MKPTGIELEELQDAGLGEWAIELSHDDGAQSVREKLEKYATIFNFDFHISYHIK